jgi:peptidoglycan/LPS O-acetylase OafA/YrhL
VSHPKQTSRYYRPELDALRFFAFFCVFLFHRWTYVAKPGRDLLQAGLYGLPLFFLLSAFLITELLLREREQTGTVHIAAFYMRRILRIWPLYFAVFWSLWLLGRHLPTVAPAPGAWLPFTFFLGNWFVIHHGWMSFPVDPLWSIAVEEQFYLFIPTLARFGGARALAIVGMVLLAVSYSVAGHFALHPPARSTALWCNSFFQFQFFAGGMLLAVLLHGRKLRIAPAVRLAMGFGGLAGWLAASVLLRPLLGLHSNPPAPALGEALLYWALILLGGILLLVAVMDIPSRAVPRSLAYLGKISYGLYLFHCMVLMTIIILWRDLAVRRLGLSLSFDWIGTPLAFALTAGLAALSYRYFESPFLRLKERFTFVRSRPVDAAAESMDSCKDQHGDRPTGERRNGRSEEP